MARDKKYSPLFGRRGRSATLGRRPTIGFDEKGDPSFPPSRKKPSKTTVSKTKTRTGGLFGRTKKNRAPIPPPPKGKPIGNSGLSVGIANIKDNWRFKEGDGVYTGPYHKDANGKFYAGSRPRRGGFFKRKSSRRGKEVYQSNESPVILPTPKPRPKPDVVKSWGGLLGGRKPSRGGAVVVTTTPYKPIDAYGNQYPAEDSSVADAKESIEPQYSSGGLKGHFYTEELGATAVSYDGNIPSLGQISVVLDTFMEFILEFDGQFFTSPQYKQKLNQANSENNPYFRIDRNAIPIISFNTSNPSFASYGDQFKEEDDYAMVDVDYRLSAITMWVKHIDYITRKTSVNQGVKTPEQIYMSKPWTIRDTASDVDAILETAGKAPKVRFKGGVTGPPVESKSSPPPKRKKKKIICNELYHQGYLPEHIWDADERWGDKTFITDPKLVIGYQMWARSVVEFMRKKPQYTPAIYFLCKPWTEWMAYDLGVLPKNNLKGQLTQFVGRYFSYAVYDLFGGDTLYKRYQELT